jgi:flagellar biosynthesis protein FlhG
MKAVFASGKGGTGKTTIIANLSVILDRPVLLVDLDYGMANLHYYFDVDLPYTLLDYLQRKCNFSDCIINVRPKLDLISIGQGNVVNASQRAELLNNIENISKHYKWTLIDCAPGVSSDVIETIKTGDFLVLVTNPDITAITDGYYLLKMLVGSGFSNPIFAIINRVTSSSDVNVFFSLKKTTLNFLQKEIVLLGMISNSYNLQKALLDKKPFIETEPESRQAKQFQLIKEELCRIIQKTKTI